MNKINKYTEVFNSDGTIKDYGYSFKNYFIYNKDKIHTRESRIKEWEFYQFIEGDYVLQFTIGHATLFDSLCTGLFNIKTGERHDLGIIKLHHKNEIKYPNTELPHKMSYYSKNFSIVFENKNNARTLAVLGRNSKYKNVNVYCEIHSPINNEKMNILTPFENSPYMFFLNYKENYYKARAVVQYDDFTIKFDNMKGLIDSGRGYWPYDCEWLWSNMTATIKKVDLGWNIGWGFGKLDKATENMMFINHKGYQLGKLETNYDWNNPYCVFDMNSVDHKFYVHMEPLYDNISKTKVLWINNICHQVFFKASGYMIDENNIKYEFKDVITFFEHAHNRW